MRRIITIVAAMVFVLAFVTAFADEMPILSTANQDVGTMLYLEEAPGHAHPKRFSGDLFYRPEDVIRPTAKKDFSGPMVEEQFADIGTVLYQSAFETKLVEPGTGMAAGGVAREDENTRIWDNLLGAPPGTHLP
jgi:hypothetical protein